jgi:predicted dehydrogenase
MDVGVIGLGVMGKNHARVYSKIKTVDSIYVYDPAEQQVSQTKHLDVTPCSSEEEVLKKADVVSICTPTQQHFQSAQKAIDAGVHCLIEKPLTLTAEEGTKLLGIVPKNLIVGVGHIERFNPIVSEIDRLADHPLYLEIKRHNPSSSRISDTTVVKDLMIHDLDIVFHTFFPGQTYDLVSFGNDDVASVLLQFKDAVVSVSASRLAMKKTRSLYVEQQDFTMEGNFMSQEVYIHRKPGKYSIQNHRYVQENIVEKVLLSKVEPLYVELETFLQCVQKKTAFPVTPEQALTNIEVCETIEKGFS